MGIFVDGDLAFFLFIPKNPHVSSPPSPLRILHRIEKIKNEATHAKIHISINFATVCSKCKVSTQEVYKMINNFKNESTLDAKISALKNAYKSFKLTHNPYAGENL